MASQAHDFWQHQFLHTAGLPATTANVIFLRDWRIYRSTAPAYNPVDLSQREPGSTRYVKLPNGRYARNYTDTLSAAQAFADQLNPADYPALQKALASGDPWGPSHHAGVPTDLHEWGSLDFAKAYVDLVNQASTAPLGGSRGTSSKNVSGAWSRLMRVFARDGHATIVELQRATASLNRIERRLRRA